MSVSEREERILGIIETARRKRPRFKDERITMAHGAGGKATQTLIEGLLAPAFGLDELADAAIVDGVALTTASFVVKPLRFPGGSIGELAVNGTVNDLAMAGARPLALSLALILEEGLDAGVLRAEVEAIAAAAERAGVRIVAGDTKVVERGHDAHAGGLGGARDRLDLRAELLRREPLLEHEREGQRERARAGHCEVVDRPVDGQLADRAAREADRLDDEGVRGERHVAARQRDDPGVAERVERGRREGGQQHALDQALRGLAARAVRHGDACVAELRTFRAGGLDDAEDPLLAVGDRHTTCLSRANRPKL